MAEEDLDDAALIDLVVMGFDRAEVIELLKENAPCQQVCAFFFFFFFFGYLSCLGRCLKGTGWLGDWHSGSVATS